MHLLRMLKGLCIGNNKTKIDGQGELSVFNMTTQKILGVDITGGTWLNLKENIMSNISNISSLHTSNSGLSSFITTIGGTAENTAHIGNYFADAQLTLAFTSGLVGGSGLLLSLRLKEDIFNAQYPLQKRLPIAGSGEVINQLT